MDALCSDFTQDQTLGADTDTVELSLSGAASCAFQLTGGTFSGTVTFEGTVTGGTWVALRVSPIGGTAGVTTATAAGIWQASCAGLLKVRARITSYSSGNLLCTIRAVQSGTDLHLLT